MTTFAKGTVDRKPSPGIPCRDSDVSKHDRTQAPEKQKDKNLATIVDVRGTKMSIVCEDCSRAPRHPDIRKERLLCAERGIGTAMATLQNNAWQFAFTAFSNNAEYRTVQYSTVARHRNAIENPQGLPWHEIANNIGADRTVQSVLQTLMHYYTDL
jgi:hypothetical protein